MKRLILSIALLSVLALPVAARQVPELTDPPPPPKAVTAPPPQSALVRAAKSSSRTKRKSAVITNDSLSKAGGHISTSKTQRPLPNISPAEMTPEEAKAIEKKYREAREAKALAEKKSEADQKLQKERNAAIYHGDDAEGMLDDPAMVEGRMNSQDPKPEAPPPPRKPPVE